MKFIDEVQKTSGAELLGFEQLACLRIFVFEPHHLKVLITFSRV